MAVVFSILDATWLQFRTHHIWYHNTYYYDIIINLVVKQIHISVLLRILASKTNKIKYYIMAFVPLPPKNHTFFSYPKISVICQSI